MNVSLTPALEKFVDGKVESGLDGPTAMGDARRRLRSLPKKGA